MNSIATRPDLVVTSCDEKFIPILCGVIICLVKGTVYDIARPQSLARRVVVHVKADPSLPVICAVGSTKVFADERAVLIPDDIGLIVRNDDAVVFRQPCQIEANHAGQHRQKIGRVLRRVLHFLCAVCFAGDPADRKCRVTADELSGVPAAILDGCCAADFLSGLPLFGSDIWAFRQNIFQCLCRTLTVGHNSHGHRCILCRFRKFVDAGDNDIVPEPVDNRRSRRCQRQRRRNDDRGHRQPR